ncbi:MAG: superinfection immunity protein [Magnetococcus sp. YQC-5]
MTNLQYILFVLIFIVYIAPAIIVFVRKHHKRRIITSLNILFGWTGVIWLIALFWSFFDERNISKFFKLDAQSKESER